MITLIINGKPHTVESKDAYTTLTELEYLHKWTAIEINGEIVPQDELKTHLLKDGDALEVITPVGGG